MLVRLNMAIVNDKGTEVFLCRSCSHTAKSRFTHDQVYLAISKQFVKQNKGPLMYSIIYK